MGGRDVVDVDQHQARLDPRHVQRQETRGLQAVRSASQRKRVPEGLRVLRRDPEFVAEVAGVAGARHGDRGARVFPGQVAELAGRQIEVAHPAEVDALDRRLGDRARPRPLERQRAEVFRDVPDRGVHAPAAVLEPAQAGLRGADQEPVLPQTLHVAVLQDVAVLVAPRGVGDPADPALRDVARHHPVEQPLGLRSLHLVLEQRRDVEEGRRVADRPVLALGRRLVRLGADVTRPVAPGAALAEGLGPSMKRRPERLERPQAIAPHRPPAAAEAALGQPDVALSVRIAADQPFRFQHAEQPVRRRGMEPVRRGQVRQPVLRLLRREGAIEGQRPLNGLRSLRRPASHRADDLTSWELGSATDPRARSALYRQPPGATLAHPVRPCG